MTMILQIYGKRQFQSISFGGNLPSGYHNHSHAHLDPLSKWPRRCISPGQDSGHAYVALIMLMDKWPNDHDIAHPQAKRVPVNFIWSESAQWLLGFGVCKIPEAYVHALLGKWPLHCTSTGQDGSKSNELDLEWIRPAGTELRHPQGSRSPCYTCGQSVKNICTLRT